MTPLKRGPPYVKASIMQNLIAAIQSSCDQQNWYAALYISLTMPDICAKLEESDSKESGKRYRVWFDKYLKPTYKSEFHGPDFHFLTSGDCWALRCSLLHEGTDEITTQKSREVLSRFKFTTQDMHRGKMNDVLVLNVAAFCSEMIAAVGAWIAATKSDSKIQGCIAEMATIETSGFSPIPGVWIGGPDGDP